MTIKTLTHIHKLLVEEKEKTYNAYIYIRDLSTAAYSDNKPNADFLSQQKDKAWEAYRAADRALDDFEEKEW